MTLLGAQDELDVVTANLSGLTLKDEPVKYEEVVARAGEVEEEGRRGPRNRREKGERGEEGGRRERGGRRRKEGDDDGEEGGRRRRSDREPEIGEKTRKRTNRKEQRLKKREDFMGKFGIFVGKIPKGVTREDLGEEFSKLNVPLPDYVDWVVKKGHAFAFWQEQDASLTLEVFSGIAVQGVVLEVELYDAGRIRIKEERRRKEQEESTEAGDAKIDDEVVKKAPRKPTKSESERKSLKEQNGVNEDTKKPKTDDSKPVTPKKTASPKSKDEDKTSKTKESSKTPVKKSPGKAPETPSRSTKSPRTSTSDTKSPSKSKDSKSSAPANTAEAGKENCSIS